MKKSVFLTIILFASIFILPSCRVHKCPANSGGYVDPPPKVNKYHYHAKLSNWPKGQKPYK